MRIILNKIINFFGKEKYLPINIGISLIITIFAIGKLTLYYISGNFYKAPDYLHLTFIGAMMWLSFIAWCVYKKSK